MRDEELLETKLTQGRRKARDEWTREYLKALLKKTRGNLTEAARLAGARRTHLQRLIRELGVVGVRRRGRPPSETATA
jgi:DNA-binding NtrC family response regulator